MNKNNKPLVSVLVPAFNHQKYVEEAVLSVINQTYGYENIQLIITDDCSSDNTVSILKELESRYKFRLIIHSKNLGVSSTLNEMISIADGKYITSFASDDVMVLDRIEKQVKILEENNDIDVLAGESILIDENSKVIGDIKTNSTDLLASFTFEDIFLLKWSGFAAGSVMIKKELFERIGAYDPEIKVEDYYFWLKSTHNKAKIVKCNSPFLYYRIHGNSISTDGKLLTNEVAKILKIYISHPEYSVALKNHKIYNLSKMVFYSRYSVIKNLFNDPALILNKQTLKIIMMLMLPAFILKKRFPENYYRNAAI